MVLGELFTESTISVVKTVWQKREDKITRKDRSRLLATERNASEPYANETKDAAHGN